MKDQLNKFPLNKIVDDARRFKLILFFTLFAGIYVYLLLFIATLNSQAATKAAVDAELQTVKRLSIDENAIQQMLQLTEESVEVKTLYEEARDNPFAEPAQR